MTELYKKLQIIKATIGGIVKTHDNPFFKSKYFDINDLIAQLQPMFEEQELLLLQPVVGRMVVTEIIDIESGEKVTAMMEIPAEITDPQKILGCVTYFRRGGLQSLLALMAEDDDGNLASQPQKQDEAPKVWLTKDQFEKAMASTPKQIEAVLKAFNGKEKAMKKEYRTELETALKSK